MNYSLSFLEDRVQGFLFFQLLGLVVFSSWYLAGLTSLGGIGIVLIFCSSIWVLIYEGFRRKIRKSFFLKLVVVFWSLFLFLLLVSFFNPTHQLLVKNEQSFFAAREYIKWLPSVVSKREFLFGFVWLFSGLVQGVILFEFVRFRTFIRLIFVFIVLNTSVLALLGSTAKIHQSKKVLGFFEFGKISKFGTFFATFTYNNHWSAFVILALCLASGLFFNALQKMGFRKLAFSPYVFLLALIALLTVSIPLSGSRSGMLFLGLYLIFFVFFLVKGVLAAFFPGVRISYIAIVASALLIGAFLIFAIKLSENDWRKEWKITTEQIQSFKDGESLDFRFYATRDSWLMFKDRPVFGWGIGSYPFIFRRYQGEELYYSDGRPYYFRYAHNDWLQWLSEVGIVGLALVMTPILYQLFLYFRIKSKSPISFWSLFGCGLVLVYSFVDFPLRTPGVLVLFVIVLPLSLKYELLERKRAGIKLD